MLRYNKRIIACYLHPITLHGYPPPAEDTGKHMRALHRLGFQSMELEGVHEQHLMKMYALRDQIVDTLDELEMCVPFFCVVLPGLSSADADIRKKNLNLFETGCRMAKALGAGAVLDNGPLPPYNFPADLPVVRHYEEDVISKTGLPASLDWAAYWKDITMTWRQACDIAGEYGLSYHMHPASGVLCANTDGFLNFFDAVGRDNLRFNLDTANQFAHKDHLQLALVRLKDHIDYIHLSDNGGSRIEHLPIHEGAIAWDPFFETLHDIQFDGFFGIDIGGDESGVDDLDRAYQQAAQFLESKIPDLRQQT